MEPDEFVSFVPMEAIGEYGSLGLEDVRELTDVYDGYTYFADGDVIIAKITPCFENGKGALAGGLTNGVGFGTTELHVVRPGPKIDRHFLFYVSIAHDFRQLGESKMRGAAGQKRIDESFIKDWMAPLPSLDIQRRIVRFLDEMTTRVDELIEKKRELLDLLAEKRQALITLTVTKDLNPDPGDTTKVSDKLSEVYQGLPSGWSIKRLKYLATYNDDVLPENTDEDMEIDYVEISGVSLSSGIDKIKRMPLGKAPTRARRMVCDGDILISTVRTYLRAITNVDAASPDLIASTGFCVVRPREGVDSSFLGWAAKSEPFVSEVVSRSAGVSYPAINASELVTISIPCPPLNVQRQIAGFLAEKTGQIDAVTNQIRRSMEYLREYRSALITATVTGQLGDTL
ncbi:MAG: restriction endonuclease subunit S [Bacteroidota bacterium]|nr:restriction endonuclease subunit S [Bacteroidota bacterium]MDE2646794.1 restriction endonuclease subunit S [Bacteroidota bacterium]